jgi:SAM-dependent methyltransferase
LSKYAMEHDREAARLEKMGALEFYDPATELKPLSFAAGQKALDVGCGSGNIAKYVADHFPGVRVEGCDLSSVRIEQARELRKKQGKDDIRFFVSPIEKIDAPDNTYDRVTCRYLFEFLTDPMAAMRELRRVLKPGGQLLVVQLDGFLHNYHHGNPELDAMLARLIEVPPVDNFRGRKIPKMMLDNGFKDVDWQVSAYGWQGKQLAGEKDNMYERLEFAAPLVGKCLGGGVEDGLRFRDLYCSEMSQPGSVLFYNKFLVRGTK